MHSEWDVATRLKTEPFPEWLLLMRNESIDRDLSITFCKRAKKENAEKVG